MFLLVGVFVLGGLTIGLLLGTVKFLASATYWRDREPEKAVEGSLIAKLISGFSPLFGIFLAKWWAAWTVYSIALVLYFGGLILELCFSKRLYALRYEEPEL